MAGYRAAPARTTRRVKRKNKEIKRKDLRGLQRMP